MVSPFGTVLSSAPSDKLLLAFHDELDFVSVHDGLLEEFRSVSISSRVRQSLESQIEAIVRSKGTKLVERTAFLHVSMRLTFSRFEVEFFTDF